MVIYPWAADALVGDEGDEGDDDVMPTCLVDSSLFSTSPCSFFPFHLRVSHTGLRGSE